MRNKNKLTQWYNSLFEVYEASKFSFMNERHKNTGKRCHVLDKIWYQSQKPNFLMAVPCHNFARQQSKPQAVHR